VGETPPRILFGPVQYKVVMFTGQQSKAACGVDVLQFMRLGQCGKVDEVGSGGADL